MDEEQQIAPGLVEKIFELGLMGIEIPEEFGGAGGSFFDAALAIEAISTVDPAVAVLVDVHNTLVINALRRWATEAQQGYMASPPGLHHRRSLRAERGWLGVRRVRTADPRRGNSTAGIASTAESCGSAARAKRGYLSSSPTSIPRPAIAASPHSWSRRARRDSRVGRKEDKLGIRASSTCELLFDNCEVPADNLLGEPGQGIQDRH